MTEVKGFQKKNYKVAEATCFNLYKTIDKEIMKVNYFAVEFLARAQYCGYVANIKMRQYKKADAILKSLFKNPHFLSYVACVQDPSYSNEFCNTKIGSERKDACWAAVNKQLPKYSAYKISYDEKFYCD